VSTGKTCGWWACFTVGPAGKELGEKESISGVALRKKTLDALSRKCRWVSVGEEPHGLTPNNVLFSK